MTRESSLLGRMLFLVGAQRSGTNWLQRILATHPDVGSLPSETQLFTHGISRVAEIVHHSALTSPTTAGVYMDPDAFYAATRTYCDAILGGLADKLAPGHAWVLERSPNHVFHLDLIGRVYPDARVVHIIRDGRDVARSQLAQPYGPSTIAEAAREWRQAIEGARAAAPLFRQYIEVRYEDLLADPPATVRTLFGSLGLPYDDALLSAVIAEAEIPFNVDPNDQRVGQGKWRSSWSPSDAATFLAEVGPLADEFGLASDAPIAADRATARRSSLRTRRRRRASRDEDSRRLSDPERSRRALRVVDLFVSDLAARRWAQLQQRVHPDLQVRVDAAGTSQSARGDEAVSLLVKTVEDDGIGWAEQIRGDVHVGTPTITVLLTHRGEDGHTVDRLLVVRPRGDRVDKVTYYRLPVT